MNGFRWIFHFHTLDARTRMVKQSVHLLPRSMIYFEDFLSSCISRHTFLYALCVGCDWNIFLMRGTKRATWNILVHGAASIRRHYTLGRSLGSRYTEEIKDLSFVNSLFFDSIRSKIFVRPIWRMLCVCHIVLYLHVAFMISKSLMVYQAIIM